jgi:hypothetical protein
MKQHIRLKIKEKAKILAVPIIILSLVEVASLNIKTNAIMQIGKHRHNLIKICTLQSKHIKTLNLANNKCILGTLATMDFQLYLGELHIIFDIRLLI